MSAAFANKKNINFKLSIFDSFKEWALIKSLININERVLDHFLFLQKIELRINKNEILLRKAKINNTIT